MLLPKSESNNNKKNIKKIKTVISYSLTVDNLSISMDSPDQTMIFTFSTSIRTIRMIDPLIINSLSLILHTFVTLRDAQAIINSVMRVGVDENGHFLLVQGGCILLIIRLGEEKL